MSRQAHVYYWHGTKFAELPWEHKQEVDYSLRFAVCQSCIDKGYQIMLRPTKEGDLIIFIDNGLFRQR